MAMSWMMSGTVLISCNCDYGCPCNFNALPTAGKCEGEWPGAIHEGNGEGLLLVDDRADDAQREAVHALVKGEAGGPWGVLAWTWPTLHGPKAVPYELELNGIRSRVRAGEDFELELEPIRNPVSGAEVTPGAVLPQGIIFKRGDFASSKRYRVPLLGIDHAGKYTAVAPFEYAGP
jgi:hypothetical protein